MTATGLARSGRNDRRRANGKMGEMIMGETIRSRHGTNNACGYAREAPGDRQSCIHPERVGKDGERFMIKSLRALGPYLE